MLIFRKTIRNRVRADQGFFGLALYVPWYHLGTCLTMSPAMSGRTTAVCAHALPCAGCPVLHAYCHAAPDMLLSRAPAALPLFSFSFSFLAAPFGRVAKLELGFSFLLLIVSEVAVLNLGSLPVHI